MSATVEELQAAPVGTWAKDAVGDRWIKTQPDTWEFTEDTDANSWGLDHVWGPIEIKGEQQ